MATMVPAQKGVEFIFYVGLVSQADTKLLQNNPTLAAGDVLVSTDGGATSNLDTLPAVTPASSDMVKVTVSTTEMNGDNIIIVFSDAAGSEWCDLIINIQTAAQSLDTTDTAVDAIPTTAMRGTDNVVLSGPTKAQMDTAHGLLATPAQVASALTTYDAPTKAEMDAALLIIKQKAAGTYNRETDSLQAIRDRGDAGWTTGAGNGGDATLANQETLIQILTGKWEVTGNQLIMYDTDGETALYTLDLTQDGVPTEFNPDLRSPV